MLFHKLLSARLIVFKTNKQTKNTSGKKLKYHGVPEGGASRTSKGATDSPACHWAAVGHYSSGGWAGAESGHPFCKSWPSLSFLSEKDQQSSKKVNWWATTLVVRGQRVDVNLCSTCAKVENYCHSCLKKLPKIPEKVWPTTSVKGGRERRGHQTCQKVEDEKFDFIFKLYFVIFPVDSG